MIKNKYRTEMIVFLVILILGGCFSVYFGQDNNYDLRNYHLYNAWSLMNGHLNKDILAAGTQTYINPLLDLPYYMIAVKWLPGYPIAVAFLGGLPYGVLVFFTWLVARKIAVKLNFGSSLETETVAILTTIFGVTGSASISQIGTTFNEIQLAVFNIAALFFLLQSTEDLPERNRRNLILLAGALLGISAGLKFTSLVYTIGAGIALLLVTRGWKPRFLAMFYFGLAWLGMFGIVYGWWGYKLWQLFGNPMFPFYNQIFKSAWIPAINISDLRFMPRSIFQTIFYPFYWLLPNAMIVTEATFSDFRFSFAYLGVVILIGSFLYRKLSLKKENLEENSAANGKDNRVFYMLIVFFVISYIFWEVEFSILRYAVPIEILSGIIFAIGIKKSGLLGKKRILMIPFLTLSIFILMVSTHYPAWGRINYDPSQTYKVLSPTLPDNSLILLENPPISYIAPFLKMKDGGSPEFIGLERYGLVKNYKLGELIRTKIQDHKGPIFVVSQSGWNDWNVLNSEFGISVDLPSCQPITSTRDASQKLCPAYIK